MGNFPASLKAFCCRLPDVQGPVFKEEPFSAPNGHQSLLEKLMKKTCFRDCCCPPDDVNLYGAMPTTNKIYTTQPGVYVSDLNVADLFELEERSRKEEKAYQESKREAETCRVWVAFIKMIIVCGIPALIFCPKCSSLALIFYICH